MNQVAYAYKPVNTEGIPAEEEIDTGYPPRPAQNAASLGESDFIDGSGPLFTMYLRIAEEEDRKLAESWKADADGILVFTGLFSAAVAALLAISIQDIRPNPQDTSAFYLANIYQLVANANGSNVTISSSLSNPSTSFSPPNWAVWVNSLWFLSLAISITCALLATFLQQWARRYTKITQPRYGPHKRARIRAFFAEGVEKLHLPLAVDALPTLVHVSLFLFFAGLLVFLFNINHTAFTIVVWWVGLCIAVYICITVMPIFRHDSPYYAPLSRSAWFLVTGILLVLFKVISWFSCVSSTTLRHVNKLGKRYRDFLSLGIEKTAEEAARELSSEIDGRALMWAFETLDEDHELERFFAGVPGFCSSKMVKDPIRCFIEPNEERLSEALIGLIHRTLASNVVSESVKQRRVIICRKTIDEAHLPIKWQIFRRVLYGEWYELLGHVEFGLVLKRVHHRDPFAVYISRCMSSIIIATVKEHDDRWFELVTSQLGVSETVLRNDLALGDSVLLANMIWIIRYIFLAQSQHSWLGIIEVAGKTLELVSKFNVQHTLPGLQHGFCALWNKIILEMKNGTDNRLKSNFNLILKHLHHIYIGLHRDTNDSQNTPSPLTSQSLYPLCNIPGHHPYTTNPHVHQLIGSATRSMAHLSATIRRDASMNTRTRHDVLFPPAPIPSYIITHPSDEPSHVDMPPAPQKFLSVNKPLVTPVNIESNHISGTSSSSALTDPTQNTTDASSTSSTANSTSNSTQPTSSLAFPLAGKDNEESTIPPPSAVPPGTPLTPALIPALNSAPHADWRLSSAFSMSQDDRTPPRRTPSPIDPFPVAARQVAQSCAVLRRFRNLSGQSLPIPVEATHHSPGPASSSFIPSRRSFDTVPFPNDANR